MKDGRRSIYLDCYRDGHRTYEYLKLYLVPETDDESVRRNEVAMQKAETARRRKLRELKKLPVGNKRLMQAQSGISKKDISLLEWLSRFKEIQRSRGVRDIYSIDRLCDILSDMGCGDTKVREIGKEFCIVFVEYLKTGYKTAKGENLKPKTAFNRQCTLVREERLSDDRRGEKADCHALQERDGQERLPVRLQLRPAARRCPQADMGRHHTRQQRVDAFRHHEQERKASAYTARRAGKKMDTRMRERRETRCRQPCLRTSTRGHTHQ